MTTKARWQARSTVDVRSQLSSCVQGKGRITYVTEIDDISHKSPMNVVHEGDKFKIDHTRPTNCRSWYLETLSNIFPLPLHIVIIIVYPDSHLACGDLRNVLVHLRLLLKAKSPAAADSIAKRKKKE